MVFINLNVQTAFHSKKLSINEDFEKVRIIDISPASPDQIPPKHTVGYML